MLSSDSVHCGLRAASCPKKRVKRKDRLKDKEKRESKGYRLYSEIVLVRLSYDCQIIRFWGCTGKDEALNDKALVLRREDESKEFDPLIYEGKYGFIVILRPRELHRSLGSLLMGLGSALDRHFRIGHERS